MRLPVCPDFSIRVVQTEDLSVRSNALISLALQFIEEPPGFLSLKNMLTLHGSKYQQPLVGGINQKPIRHISNRLNLKPEVMNRAVEIPCTGKKKPQAHRFLCERVLLEGMKVLFKNGTYQAVLDKWNLTYNKLEAPGINLATQKK